MNARDELAQIWADAYEQEKPVVDAILAAGYRKPRTITTREELDALYQLDRNVVIADEFGNAFQNLVGGWRAAGVDHFWSSSELHRKLGPDFTVLSIQQVES